MDTCQHLQPQAGPEPAAARLMRLTSRLDQTAMEPAMPSVRTISRHRHLLLTLLGALLPMLDIDSEPVPLQNEVITATRTAQGELRAPASVRPVERRVGQECV